MSALKKINKPIVTVLMDQKKIGSGIGNYLSAEILYRSKISPHRICKDITDNEIKILEYWIKYVVKLSYAHNKIGYMINLEDDHHNVKKINYHPKIKLHENTFKFYVYRRKQDPFGNKVIGDKIVGSGVNKRTTYWVPSVQK